MNATKQALKKALVGRGTRDAVETAIDLAKDGQPWEKRTGRIARWPAAKRHSFEDCEKESEDLEEF